MRFAALERCRHPSGRLVSGQICSVRDTVRDTVSSAGTGAPRVGLMQPAPVIRSRGGCCTKPSREGRSVLRGSTRQSSRAQRPRDGRPARDGRDGGFRSPPLEAIQRARRGFVQQPPPEAVAAASCPGATASCASGTRGLGARVAGEGVSRRFETGNPLAVTRRSGRRCAGDLRLRRQTSCHAVRRAVGAALRPRLRR